MNPPESRDASQSDDSAPSSHAAERTEECPPRDSELSCADPNRTEAAQPHDTGAPSDESGRTVAYQPLGSEAATIAVAHDDLPARIGRFKIKSVLGEGGFGIVYLADDEQLRRKVAIKVSHKGLVPCRGDALAYLTEVPTVAGLDHPNIVPVYDVGSTDECPCYVVKPMPLSA